MSTALRQLVVIAEMGTGGAESVVVQLARAAVDRGDQVVVASDAGWRTAALQDLGATHLPVPLADGGARALARTVRVLRRHLAGSPVDVVHAHNVRAALAARLAVVGRRTPVLVTLHGISASRYRPAARVLRWAADQVVAVSDDVRDRLVVGGMPADRVAVVPTAPEPPEAVDRSEARAGLGLSGDERVVLCLARLEPPKRQDLLLRAWSDVPRAVLLVAGDGSRRAALEALAGELGVAERVRFLGDRRDVGRLLAAADALVLPSDSEGLPVAVLEAMSVGVPVVASRVGGLAALDPRVLVLVEPGSVPALVAGLAQCLDDASAERPERARQLVASSYSSSAMARYYAVRLADLGTKLAKGGEV